MHFCLFSFFFKKTLFEVFGTLKEKEKKERKSRENNMKEGREGEKARKQQIDKTSCGEVKVRSNRFLELVPLLPGKLKRVKEKKREKEHEFNPI